MSLTAEQKDAIVRKAISMRRNFHANRMKVARCEMNPKRCEELQQREVEELQELLREAG